MADESRAEGSTAVPVGDRGAGQPSPAGRAATGRRVRAAAWALVAVPFAVQAVGVLTGTRAWLVHRLPDDAYYYLEIARRIGRGEGVTFDGISSTTGVHPLWQVVLVPVARLLPGDEALVRAVLLLSLAVLALSLVLAIRLVQRATGPGPAMAAGIVAAWSAPLFRVTVSGLEGPVVVLAMVLAALALERWDRRPTAWRAVVVGLALAIAVLARLDVVTVVWFVPVAVWRRRTFADGLRVLGGAAVVGVPVAVAFFALTGQVTTTSALVKQVWMDRLAAREGGRVSLDYLRFLAETGRSYVTEVVRGVAGPALASPLPDVAAVVPAAVAGTGAALAVAEHRRHPGRWGSAAWALAVVGGVVAAKAVVDVVLSPLWASAWYSAPVRVAAALAVGGFGWVALDRIWHRSVPMAAVLAVAVGLVALPLDLGPVLAAGRTAPQADLWQDQIDEAAARLLADPPAGRIGALDAGLLGFVLDPTPVVNLDGLVNDYEYVQLVREGRSLRELISAEEVDVLVNRLTDAQVADLGCGVERWRSVGGIAQIEADGTESSAPVRVLDVRSCLDRE